MTLPINPTAQKLYQPIAANDFISCSEFSSRTAFGPLVHDKPEGDADRRRLLDMHISSDSYFGTIATLLDLMLRENEKIDADNNRLIRQLRDDLMYLHKNYRISKKS